MRKTHKLDLAQLEYLGNEIEENFETGGEDLTAALGALRDYLDGAKGVRVSQEMLNLLADIEKLSETGVAVDSMQAKSLLENLGRQAVDDCSKWTVVKLWFKSKFGN